MRRRFCVVTSDDEEGDDSVAPTTSSSVLSASTLPIPSTSSNPSATSPLIISDEDQEDFVTVPDDLSTPSPPLSIPTPPSPSTYDTQSASSNSRIAPIDQLFRRLGLCVRHEWLEACSDRIFTTMHGYDGLDDDTKANKIFEQFLFADLNECGAGVLPENVGMMHKTELEGPYVLQV